MKDNVGNEIHLGDFVYCYSGKHKNRIQQVHGFRVIHDEQLGELDAVNFSDKDWLRAANVVSLNALGVTALPDVQWPLNRCDILGNPLHIGDKVMYMHRLERDAETGVVKSMTDKSCLLSIQENWFGQTEYRKKYEELISLTALGKEDFTPAPREYFSRW